MLHQSSVQKQTQKFSPLQIQMLNLLHLSSQELEQKVKDELEENPALEPGADEENSKEDDFEGQEDEFQNSNEEDFSEFSEQYEDDVPQYKTRDVYNQSEDENYSIPIIQNDSFYEKIKDQVRLMNLSDRYKMLADFLIDSLDEDGYLRTDLEDLSYQYSFSNGEIVVAEEFEAVLKVIQRCDPAGIGARNLRECLLIQLARRKGSSSIVDVAYTVMDKYVSDMENRNYSRIIRMMGISSDELKEAIQLIAKLNPKPNVITDESLFSNHVIPEFVVTTSEGELNVSLANKSVPEIKVNPKIQEIMDNMANSIGVKKQGYDKSTVSFMKNKISSAKWLVDALKQRETTMINIIKAIAQLQYNFFITGDFKNLKPMILKNVADVTGMDISSISRVTSNKYVQTNFGTFLLKELFSEGLSTQNGEMVSNKEIHNIIKKMLESENKADPLTDFQISDMLKEKGYNVARRTVAKYRDCLSIPGAKMRKEIVS